VIRRAYCTDPSAAERSETNTTESKVAGYGMHIRYHIVAQYDSRIAPPITCVDRAGTSSPEALDLFPVWQLMSE